MVSPISKMSDVILLSQVISIPYPSSIIIIANYLEFIFSYILRQYCIFTLMKYKSLIIFQFLIFCSLISQAQKQQSIDSLETVLLEAKNDKERIEYQLVLTDFILPFDQDKAFSYAQQTLKLAEKNRDNKSQLLANLQIGEIYWSKADYRSSMEVVNKAKEMAESLRMDKEYAEAIVIISKNYSSLGDYNKSADLNFQALRIFEKLDYKKGIGEVFSQIGSVYYHQGNTDKALEYYTKSLNIAREINDLVGISRDLNNVAAVYGKKKEFDNLESKIREAVLINKKLGRKLWEGINYMNLGSLSRDKNKPDTSLYYYHKAGAIFKELNNIPKLISIYVSLSEYYSAFNDIEKSLQYAEMAYNLGKENKLKTSIYEAAKQLHHIYKYQHDIENSYKYSTLEYQMKDSLDLETSTTKLSQLELLYEFEKVSQEEKIRQQHREYVYIIVGIGFGFVFILIIILIINRNKLRRKNQEIEKQRLKSQLEIRDKELTSNAMSLMRKNEALSDIAGKLMDIRVSAIKDETKFAIKKIVKELQNNKDKEVWKEFDMRFKQVHMEFYNKLIKQFPDLTPTEQRLCAFLRLNMTTKEISELTGQRTGTIEMARSRVRKKLGLTHDQTNLITFLSQI